mgnify:CR=1 FL=1
MDKKVSSIIFWGAAWGLTEATLGYVLHAFDLKIGWLFWFPIAFVFLERVYHYSGSAGAVFYSATIASAIKLVDLLLPTRIDLVINPAISILLEGLVVFAFLKVKEHNKKIAYFSLGQALTISVSWRILYGLYILLMPVSFFNVSPLKSSETMLRFFLLESTINSLVVYTYIKVKGVFCQKLVLGSLSSLTNWVEKNEAFRTSISILMLLLAFICQWVF